MQHTILLLNTLGRWCHQSLQHRLIPGCFIPNMGVSVPVPAGTSLSDDANTFLFGIDTKRDDIEITNVVDAEGNFHGEEVPGFSDSDGDGIKNQVLAWHLPFDFSEADMIAPGEVSGVYSFTVSEKLTHFEYWIGGSDDTNTWNDGHDMGEGEYGIYDATLDENGNPFGFLVTFITRSTTAVELNNANKVMHHDF